MHASEIDVRLVMRDRSEADLLAALRRDFASVPAPTSSSASPSRTASTT
jgi:hypothetical protein